MKEKILFFLIVFAVLIGLGFMFGISKTLTVSSILESNPSFIYNHNIYSNNYSIINNNVVYNSFNGRLAFINNIINIKIMKKLIKTISCGIVYGTIAFIIINFLMLISSTTFTSSKWNWNTYFTAIIISTIITVIITIYKEYYPKKDRYGNVYYS